MEGRRNGALISMEQGKAVAFAIFNLQARGEMFVTHNDPVYPGMIVGLSPKPGDMIINVMKGKKLTNMRTQGTDENVVLTPVRKMSIAEQLSMLNTDEALEITPESCRLRKAILDPHERKRSEKSGAAANQKFYQLKINLVQRTDQYQKRIKEFQPLLFHLNTNQYLQQKFLKKL